MKFLPTEELHEALSAENKSELFVAGYCDFDNQHLILFKGDGKSIVVPFLIFKSYGGIVPDFDKFDIIDTGQTVALGNYEASNRGIFRAIDPEYDKKCEVENEIGSGKGKKVFN